MQGVQNLSPPVLKQIQGEAFRQIASLALSDRDAGRTVNQAADGVIEISSKDGESVRITVDEKTGLPAKLAYQQSPAEGGAAVEEIFSDWRDVDGLHLPFQWTVMQGGKKFAGCHRSGLQDQFRADSGNTGQEARDHSARHRQAVRPCQGPRLLRRRRPQMKRDSFRRTRLPRCCCAPKLPSNAASAWWTNACRPWAAIVT